MAYYCQCGKRLKAIGVQGITATTKRMSNKILHVESIRYYKCPNDCKLESISER